LIVGIDVGIDLVSALAKIRKLENNDITS